MRQWRTIVLLGTCLTLGPLFAQTPSPAGEGDDGPTGPHWENEITLGSMNQQGGQALQIFGYTGSYFFSDNGDFLSAELSGTRQKIEGVFSKTGGLSLSGGLGLGAFSPSLSLGFELGESALRQFNLGLALVLQLNDSLGLSLTLGGNVGSHQGDLSDFYPSLPGTVQIDTAGGNSSLGASVLFLDWFSAYLGVQYTNDRTYRIEAVDHPDRYVPVEQVDQTASLTLGLDFVLLKGLTLDLSPQVGQEYQPAGAVYSPQAGGLVVNSVATTQNFVGGTTSLSLRF